MLSAGQKLKKLDAFMIMILVIVIVLSSFAEASAFSLVKKDKKSAMVVIGDSRIAHMYKAGYSDVSTIAVGTGQYSTNDNKTIHSKCYSTGQNLGETSPYKTSRYKCIQNSIVHALKKHHKCKVIIFATINECNSDLYTIEEAAAAASAITSLSRKCHKTVTIRKRVKKGRRYITKKYKYSSKVYVIQCPKAKCEYFPDEYVDAYNAAIKENEAKETFIFVPVREPYDYEYIEDGIHFMRTKTGYNRYLRNLFNAQKYK